MRARSEETAWLVPVLATMASLAGAAVTFWIGRTIGEHGLERMIGGRRLARVKQRVKGRAAVTIAALALVPPPRICSNLRYFGRKVRIAATWLRAPESAA